MTLTRAVTAPMLRPASVTRSAMSNRDAVVGRKSVEFASAQHVGGLTKPALKPGRKRKKPRRAAPNSRSGCRAQKPSR